MLENAPTDLLIDGVELWHDLLQRYPFLPATHSLLSGGAYSLPLTAPPAIDFANSADLKYWLTGLTVEQKHVRKLLKAKLAKHEKGPKKNLKSP